MRWWGGCGGGWEEMHYGGMIGVKQNMRWLVMGWLGVGLGENGLWSVMSWVWMMVEKK